MKRVLIISAALILVIAAAVLAWHPWSETVFTAEDVPASCTELADLREQLAPGASDGQEKTFDRAGTGRVTGNAAGTTLTCGWTTDSLAVQLAVEYWEDGVDAAEASFAQTRAEFSEKGSIVNAGDEAVVAVLAGTSATAAVRFGNVIFQIRPTVNEQGTLTTEQVTAMLQAAVKSLG